MSFSTKRIDDNYLDLFQVEVLLGDYIRDVAEDVGAGATVNRVIPQHGGNDNRNLHLAMATLAL